jgi:ABC-2 type transport system permease protein
MFRPLLVALREVRTYLQDKADLSFSLLLPIAIFALMYGAFGGQSQFHGTASIVNEDPGGKYSTLLLDRLRQSGDLDVQLLSPADADAKLEKAILLMVVYIPSDFSTRVTSGQSTQLVFKQRGNGGNEGQIVASLMRGVVEEIANEVRVQDVVANTLAGQNISAGHIEVTVEKFIEKQQESPIVMVTEDALGTSPDPVDQFLPGIITMFVLFAITLTARAIVEERRKGTLERLLTTRLTVGQLFTGKFLASVARGFVQTLILLLLAYLVFRIFSPVSFLEVLVIALVFAAAASAIGLVIASIVRSEDAATWIAVFFTMAMVMVSGTFFAISKGSVLYTISRVSINTYANEAFKTIIVGGGSLADVRTELVVLAGVAVVGLIVSRVFFRVISSGR